MAAIVHRVLDDVPPRRPPRNIPTIPPVRPAQPDRYTRELEAEVERLMDVVDLLQAALALADQRLANRQPRPVFNAPPDPAPGGSDQDERMERRERADE